MAYDPNNIFAKILRGEIPSVKVYEDDKTLAFMDVMPQADGHTLVIPKEPAETLFDLSPEGAAALMVTTQKVARAVRKDGVADTPIIALTGRVGAQEKAACLAAGCTSYLAKPIEPKVLIKRLREFLAD